MPSPVKNSHYVSQVFLRNWRHPERGDLTCFDFRTGLLTRELVRETYVSPTPLSPSVERWQSDNIEAPIGEFFARWRRDLEAPISPTPREARAIMLALIVQGDRTMQSRDGDDSRLEDLHARPREYVDQLVAAYDSRFRVSLSSAPAGDALCYPQDGFVLLPLVGAFAFFIPLHPFLYAVTAPRTAHEETRELIVGKEHIAETLSVGHQGDLVIVPPFRDGAEAATEKWLRDSRGHAQQWIETFKRLNELPPELASEMVRLAMSEENPEEDA